MLVCPGNPPRRHPPPAAPDRACFRDRLVRLAPRASSHGPSLTSQTKAATVVLRLNPDHGRADAIHNACDSMRIGVEQDLVGSRGGPPLLGRRVISMKKIGRGASE